MHDPSMSLNYLFLYSFLRKGDDSVAKSRATVPETATNFELEALWMETLFIQLIFVLAIVNSLRKDKK